jgi:hypothetical protein
VNLRFFEKDRTKREISSNFRVFSEYMNVEEMCGINTGESKPEYYFLRNYFTPKFCESRGS